MRPNHILEQESLFIRKLKVIPSVLIGLAKTLEKSSVYRVLCKTYSISSGSRSFMQDNVFSDTMPKRVVIGL